MSYLLDTNILSELRKGRRCNPGVLQWFKEVSAEEIFLSVLSLGEIRKGIERARHRDPVKAQRLETWLAEVEAVHSEQILPIDGAVAHAWGRLSAGETLPVVDSLIAATAMVYGLEVVSRDHKDLSRCGVSLLDPFVTP